MTPPVKSKSKKRILARVRLQLQAGKATPAPPVGPCLAPKGVNLGAFCSEFNEKTKGLDGVIAVIVEVFQDKSFQIVFKGEPTANMLLRQAKVASGSKKPGSGEVCGTIEHDKVVEIAKMKIPNMGGCTLEAAIKSVEGTARSIGLKVVRPDQ